jgi:hypothetical protein
MRARYGRPFPTRDAELQRRCTSGNGKSIEHIAKCMQLSADVVQAAIDRLHLTIAQPAPKPPPAPHGNHDQHRHRDRKGRTTYGPARPTAERDAESSSRRFRPYPYTRTDALVRSAMGTRNRLRAGDRSLPSEVV